MNISQLRLLTRGNPKTVKGQSKGYLTFIQHFSPANLSSYEVCPHRTRECTALCLNLAGRGGLFKTGETTNTIQLARIRRTKFFMERREQFMQTLFLEIETAIRYATKKGLIPVFRLNGTSDIVWESVFFNPPVRYGTLGNIFEHFPDVQFYDYTKHPFKARATELPNYHLTFSYAETKRNHMDASQWLQNGFNVSAVFDTENFPATFLGYPTLNGDTSDLRFLDASGHVVALKAKGRLAKRHKTGGFINATKELI